jgi:hypothetical protein
MDHTISWAHTVALHNPDPSSARGNPSLPGTAQLPSFNYATGWVSASVAFLNSPLPVGVLEHRPQHFDELRGADRNVEDGFVVPNALRPPAKRLHMALGQFIFAQVPPTHT